LYVVFHLKYGKGKVIWCKISDFLKLMVKIVLQRKTQQFLT